MEGHVSGEHELDYGLTGGFVQSCGVVCEYRLLFHEREGSGQ